VFAHGFLTVNGQKMSKSRGTFIAAETYLQFLNPEYLRYYYAVKLGSGIEDIDLNLEDFGARVNSDLVGKLVNIASRCAGFITRQYDGRLATELEDPGLFAEFVAHGDQIAGYYDRREYSRAMREIMLLADRANQYIDQRKPWLLAKDDATANQVQGVCTQGINLFRVLMVYLAPVLPAMAEKVAGFLNVADTHWDDRKTPLLDTNINKFEPLMSRIDKGEIEKMVEAAKDTSPAEAENAAVETADNEFISIDDFLKIDLRVAEIKEAATVDGADKLLRVTLDDGAGGRTVLAGIRSAYEPAALVGRLVIVVANLQPRKMRFGTSEGMILAAGDKEIFLIAPDSGAKPGMRVR
jgi:methionyl-tRNA synthetase